MSTCCHSPRRAGPRAHAFVLLDAVSCVMTFPWLRAMRCSSAALAAGWRSRAVGQARIFAVAGGLLIRSGSSVWARMAAVRRPGVPLTFYDSFGNVHRYDWRSR